MTTCLAPTPTQTRTKLPMVALLALTTAVFITSLTETLPAGVLTEMSHDLHVSSSAMGQSITIYALGTVTTAVPLAAATARWRRKVLLLMAMGGFTIANTVTALTSSYPVSMAARFIAGVAAGVAWALLAGYARKLAPEHLQGRAIAVAMTGIPVALSIGVPAGTFLGKVLSWQVAFAAISALSLLVIVWITAAVPDFPGQPRQRGNSTLSALKVAGVTPVLIVTLVFVLAHTIIYAYVATYLNKAGLGSSTDAVLLVFGIACLTSIWIVGRYIDTSLRGLSMTSIALVLVAAIVFSALAQSPAAVYVAAFLWGLGWGGIPTLLQTAAGKAGAAHSVHAADSAQAMLVTLWNAAMALGGIIGGVILAGIGAVGLPVATAVLSLPVLLIVIRARQHAFPPEAAAAGADQ